MQQRIGSDKTRNVRHDTRRAKRTKCKLAARITASNRFSDGSVFDVSEGGIGLTLSRPATYRPGTKVEVVTEDFGVHTGVVTWQNRYKLGVKLDQTTNSAAQIDAYFKYLHRGPR